MKASTLFLIKYLKILELNVTVLECSACIAAVTGLTALTNEITQWHSRFDKRVDEVELFAEKYVSKQISNDYD